MGFTLVELLVAVVLLAVGALGAVAVQRTAVKANQGTYANEVATSLARQILEATKNLDYEDGRLAATTPPGEDCSSLTGTSWEPVPDDLTMEDVPAFYEPVWCIRDSAPINKNNLVVKTVRVRVGWNQAGQNRMIVLSTFMAWGGNT